MACLPCAIEMEPKTLNEGQINHARAVAIQLMEPERASDIFVQGLREVESLEGIEQIIKEDEVITKLGNSRVDDCSKDEKNKNESSHHCLCTTILINSPDELTRREPVTAPF
ncbi:uncharacterized protein LOC104904755 isoform X2 [Beta vulgaris subsp. vulgaris]|uniref:uncharacterized protein LOC104904755 isoform X2 n=1 Tax=Beta vulgaris subsp. vulgaris TaxID=3555 RepID=UPI002036F573|nr:uncharacterized protein LOC104904755 isoform X2 [Beta vulgaris subsp. vulgaris]